MFRYSRPAPATLIGIAGPVAALLWIVFSSRTDWAAIWAVGLLGALTASLALWQGTASSSSYGGFVRRSPDSHLLIVLVTLALGLQREFTEGITSDGCLYFAHLRSLIFDGDLDIGPELGVLNLPPRPSHVVAIGSAWVWLPLYLVVRMADAAGLVDEPGALAGLGGPYARAALVSSLLAAAAGLWAIHQRLRREFGGTVALIASVLLFVATPLAWYAIYEPAMTHAASFGLVALFILGAERWRGHPPSRTAAAALGVVFSLILSVRPQDGLFGVFLLAAIAASWTDRASRIAQLQGLAWFAAGAVPLIAVQLATLSALMARQPLQLVGETGYLHVFDSRWLDALFSSRHGFFSWTPIAYVAAIGTVCYLVRNRAWAASALIVLAAMSWVNGSADDWWGGWAFGGRRFTSTLPALAPGLALSVAWVGARPLLALMPVVIAVLGWNILLMQQYHHERIPRDAAVSFQTLVRQQGELLAEQMGVYPFAFPANVWFAWREALPVDRYDLLAPEPLRPRVELALDEHSRRFLLNGWGETDRDESGPFFTVAGEEAMLALPLDPPRAPPPTLEIEAGTGPSRQPTYVVLRVEVNGRMVGEAALEPARRTFVFDGNRPDLPRDLWRKGYNRVAFRKLRGRTVAEESWQPASSDRARRWPVALYGLRVSSRPSGFAR
jgi:hypothetical protein